MFPRITDNHWTLHTTYVNSLLLSIDHDILTAGDAGVEVVPSGKAGGSLPDVGDVVQLCPRESLVYD